MDPFIHELLGTARGWEGEGTQPISVEPPVHEVSANFTQKWQKSFPSPFPPAPFLFPILSEFPFP